MTTAKDLWASYKHHVDAARRIADEFVGKDMPAEAAREMQAHLEQAEQRKTSLSEPQYKHDMGAGDTGWRGIDGAVSTASVKMFAPGQKLAADPDSKALGGLGVLAKSLVGDVNAREVSAFMPEGFKDMLSGGSAGVLVPTPIAGFVIDRLRNASVVNRLGARTVPMASKTLSVPRITADPTAAWLAEGATITPNDGAMDDVTLTSKRLTAIVKFSDELDEDSDPELAGDVLANSLARAFALELDRAALRGSGTGEEPLGVRNQTGVQILDLGANGADASWDTLADLAALIDGANAAPNGFAWSTRTANNVAKIKASGSGEYLRPPESISGMARVASNAVPTDLDKGTTVGTVSEIYSGMWSDLYLGLRVGFELRRLSERYAEEGKVALRARLRADVQLAHGASFAVAIGVTN